MNNIELTFLSELNSEPLSAERAESIYKAFQIFSAYNEAPRLLLNEIVSLTKTANSHLQSKGETEQYNKTQRLISVLRLCFLFMQDAENALKEKEMMATQARILSQMYSETRAELETWKRLESEFLSGEIENRISVIKHKNQKDENNKRA
jgi:hypothetical protein